MNKRILTICTIFILSIFAFGFISDGASISGTVMDLYSGEIIEGAFINVISGPTVVSTTSNESGYFILSGLTPGMYEIEVGKNNYFGYQISGIEVKADQNVMTYAFIEEMELEYSSIGGVTKDDSGIILSGVLVRLMGGSINKSVTTSSDGSYLFESLEPGSYTLIFSRSGYITKQLMNIVIENGQGTSTINMNLQEQAGNITGKIIDSKGSAVEGALIKVLNDQSKNTYTDINGNYKISNVIAGNYNLEISRSGYFAVEKHNVIVSSGKTTAGVDVTLKPRPGLISGVVYGEGQYPLKGAIIKIINGTSKNSTIADEFGNYMLTDLMPGIYSLEISFVNYQAKVIESIEVESDKSTRNINATLIPSYGILALNITKLKSKDILEEVSVEILSYVTSENISSKGSGKRTINIEPGIYTVKLSKDGYQTKFIYDVELKSGEVMNLNAELEPSGSMFGFVYGDYNSPVSGALVEITNGSAKISANTDKNGYYYFSNLSVGNYSMSVSTTGYATYLKDNLKVENEKLNVNVDIALSSLYGSLSGVVKAEKDGKVIGNTLVEISGPVNKSTVTSSNGTYRFSDLPPGEYSIKSSVTMYATDQKTKIEIKAASEMKVDFSLKETGSFTGTISFGTVVEPKFDIIFEFSGPTNFTRNKSVYYYSSVSFNFNDIQPGKYRVRIYMNCSGYKAEEVELEIEILPGGKTTENINLTATKI